MEVVAETSVFSWPFPAHTFQGSKKMAVVVDCPSMCAATEN